MKLLLVILITLLISLSLHAQAMSDIDGTQLPADAYWLRLVPSQPEYGLFRFNYLPFDVNGEAHQDHVVNFGWNCAAGGGPLIASKGAFCQQFESHYAIGGPTDPRRLFEWHLNFWDVNGNSSRPISVSGDKVGGLSTVALTADTFSIKPTIAGANTYAYGNQQSFDFAIDDLKFRGYTNNSLRAQINSSGFLINVPLTVNGLIINSQGSTVFRIGEGQNQQGRILLGFDEANSMSMESGVDGGIPTPTRNGGSVYFRTFASAKDGSGQGAVTGMWVKDHYLGWQRVAAGGYNYDDITLFRGKQILFSAGNWYDARDVGLKRMSAARLQVTDGGSSTGDLEVGTLYLKDGTSKQVTWAAADSCGQGYKCLRVAN